MNITASTSSIYANSWAKDLKSLIFATRVVKQTISHINLPDCTQAAKEYTRSENRIMELLVMLTL